MNIIEIDGFEGHIVLYCKGHYKTDNVLEGFRKIWAIRHGYPYDNNKADKNVMRYVADTLLQIIKKINNDDLGLDIFEGVHRSLNNSFRLKTHSPIELLVIHYTFIIQHSQIKMIVGDGELPFIKLPEPDYHLFEKILSGNGEYNDYKKL